MAEVRVYMMEQCFTVVMEFIKMTFGFDSGLVTGGTYKIGGGYECPY